MANLNWVQEIEDDFESWDNLENVCYSNGKVVFNSKWFDEPIVSEKFYLIIRTAYINQNSIIAYLRSLFIKIAEIELVEIPSEDVKFKNITSKTQEVRAFVAEYRIINFDLWETENLANLIYYVYVLSIMLDYSFSAGRASGMSLGNIIFNLFQEEAYFDPDRFFHSGMASLLNNLIDLRRTKKREHHFVFDGPRFLSNDIDGIGFVLQSREDLNEALSRVKDLDATSITDEILIQYDKMRRNF